MPNRLLNLAQESSGYIVRSLAQYRHSLRRAEIHNMGKVGRLQKALGLVSAAHKRLICRAACETGFQPHGEVEFVQFLQKTVRRILRERGEIVRVALRSR